MPALGPPAGPDALNTVTTGQVARLMHVAGRTVSKWIDTGLLAGFRVPGSLDRRVEVSALAEFCRGHNWPLPAGLSAMMAEREQVYLCTMDNGLAGETMLRLKPVNCRHIRSPFQLGFHGRNAWVDTVVIDMAFQYGRVTTQNLILEAYHGLPWGPSALWVFLCGDDESSYDPPNMPKCDKIHFVGNEATPGVIAAAVQKYLRKRHEAKHPKAH